jgi:hypothetical protein
MGRCSRLLILPIVQATSPMSASRHSSDLELGEPKEPYVSIARFGLTTSDARGTISCTNMGVGLRALEPTGNSLL